MVYCGVDVIEVDRVKEAITSNEKFKYKVYGENEILCIEKSTDKLKYQRYAGRFAAKEAIFKALSKILLENKLSIDFIDIEIINESKYLGRPKVVINNMNLKRLLDEQNINIDISISHVQSVAIAMATVQK